MKIIVGLGNPGKSYENTYHNLGFAAVDRLAAIWGVKFAKKECEAVTAVASFKGEKIILAKPQTFMNLSGNSVYQLLRKYNAQCTMHNAQ
jgi:PTH1 family peptidyl-tRNA hydrolase